MVSLYPSLIAADQLNLEKTIHLLEPHCQGFHCDIMDNHFVSNLTWGPLVVNAIARSTKKPLWIHLMVERPVTMLEQLELPPASTVSFHRESTPDVEKTVRGIKEKQWRTSLALSPKTDLQAVFPFLPSLDQVLVMSVEPGASGQAFLPESLVKIRTLAAYRKEHNLSFMIGVDGGIIPATIASVVASGGQELVLGSAVFGHGDPVAALASLRALCA